MVATLRDRVPSLRLEVLDPAEAFGEWNGVPRLVVDREETVQVQGPRGIMLYLFGEETRFAVYGLGALIGLAFLPGLVRRVGSLERLLFAALVLSLQFDVALAYKFRPFKPAGPYGILISPTLVLAASLLVLRIVLAARRLGPPLRLDARMMRWIGVMRL